MDDLFALYCIIILTEIFDSYLLASLQLLVEYTRMSYNKLSWIKQNLSFGISLIFKLTNLVKHATVHTLEQCSVYD